MAGVAATRSIAETSDEARVGVAARLERAPAWLMYGVVLAVQAAVMLPIATTRAFDGDEGFYALSIKLVADGEVPYEDFWSQHPPLLPYVYAAWSHVVGDGWYSLRMLSALLTIALGVLLYWHVSKRFASRAFGLGAVFLFAGSALVFQWYPTVKSYALSTLLLFVAYVLVAGVDRVGADRPPGIRRWLAAGVLLGLAVDTRLLFAGVVPVFVLYAAFSVPELRPRLRNVVSVLGGVALGILPMLYFFALGPRRFISDTLRSQTTRSNADRWDAILQKLRTIGDLLDDGQFLILTVATVTLVVVLALSRARIPLAISIAAALGVVSLLPTPVYLQYFTTLVPFLVVAVLGLLRSFWVASDMKANGQMRAIFGGLVVVAGAAYLAVAIYSFDVTMKWDNGLLLQPSDAERVAEAINAHTRPGEVVLALAPGDLYESHAQQLRGVASEFAAPTMARMGFGEERARRHAALTFEGIEKAIRSRDVRLVVLPRNGHLLLYRPWKEILDESGYRPLSSVKGAVIYERRRG